MPTKKPKQAVWNPSKRVRAFLAAYKLTGRITKAADAAGISRWAHYRLLEKSPQYRAEFAKADLIAADSLEDEAVRRAREGVRRPVVYHGNLVTIPKDPNDPESEVITLTEVEYSDTLLLALLKAKKPEQYRERIDAKHSGEISVKKFDGTMEELLALYRDLLKGGDSE